MLFSLKTFHNFVKLKTKKMKTLVKASFIVAVAAIVFTGCKKGENDPFLSLKSRTSRLSQEWKLASADFTETSTSTIGSVNYSSSTHYTYDGTEMNESSSNTIGTSTTTSNDSYLYSNEIEFTKEGSFEQTLTYDGNSSVGSGYWTWIHKIKDQDLSNKEAIILTFASGASYTMIGTSISPDQIMVVDKLSKSELVILYDYKETSSDGEVTTETGTMTFEVK